MSKIKLIFSAIDKYDPKKLSGYLSLIPVEKMAAANSDLLLAGLLNRIYNLKQQTPKRILMIRLVMLRWTNLDPKTKEEVEGEALTLFESLFFNPNLPTPTLKFIASIQIDYSLYRVMSDVVDVEYNNKATYNTLFGLKRIFKVYEGSYQRKEVELISKQGLKLANDTIYEYTKLILKKMVEYAPKPDWIIATTSLEKESILKAKLKSSPKKNYSLEEMINIIKTKAKEDKLALVNLDLIKDKLKSLNYSQQLDLIHPFLEETEIEKNKLAFRLYGPSNRYPFPDEEDLKDYRDRMLQCDYFEIDPDTGEKEIYRGVCWQCSLHLKHKWYAVRAPLLGGGWKGWFCNWKCCTDWLNIIYEPNLTKNEELYRLAELVGRMKKLIDQYGIIDRLEG